MDAKNKKLDMNVGNVSFKDVEAVIDDFLELVEKDSMYIALYLHFNDGEKYLFTKNLMLKNALRMKI